VNTDGFMVAIGGKHFPTTTTMSHSTPHRSSGSKQASSDHFGHTPPTKQDTLKRTVASELADATWQLDPVTLARALSSKTRKVDVPSLTITEVDELENYSIKIDQLEGLLDDAVKALEYPINSAERDHYVPLMTFLNACVDACRGIYDKSLFYKQLNFIVFDRSTQDGVLGAGVLKPDGVGGNGLSPEPSTRLWWRPPSGDRSSTVEIPVEVKVNWADLVSQAGTYSRALTSARPLRQFSLVIAYNHSVQQLRFLVFHSGGLTASHALRPNEPADHKDILRLILSLLTWKTPADAGLPEWTNDVEMFVQKGEDDQEGLRMRIEEILYERLGVRGRGVKVSRLRPTKDQSESSAPTAPVVSAMTSRRSARLAEKARKLQGTLSEPPIPQIFAELGPAQSSNQSSQKSETSSQGEGQQAEATGMWYSRVLTYTNITSEAGIAVFKDREINFVRRQLHDFSKEIDPQMTDIVSKCSWVGKSYISIESKMLRKCGGMFGVTTHYHSSIICHKEGLPATNHLFLKNAKFWPLYTNTRNNHVPDFRALMQHFLQFAGRSLVTVRNPGDLFVSIVHAALGRYLFAPNLFGELNEQQAIAT
jgi:hypothetical protein